MANQRFYIIGRVMHRETGQGGLESLRVEAWDEEARMDYWQELINLFPSEEQEAVERPVAFLQDHLGIQVFEGFAMLPVDELA